MIEMAPIWLSVKLAFLTTLFLLIIGIPIAFWLSRSKSVLRTPCEAIISLPLVLPPTVIGFYLLMVFSPNNWLGEFLNETLGIKIAFSFTGLLIGSIIYSLPFMINSLQAGFSQVPIKYEETAILMRKTKLELMFKVLLPNMKKSITTGVVLTFAHTIGEFGVVLLIGGNIPNKTKVVSIAIYDAVETLNYSTAHTYAGILVGVMFLLLIGLGYFNKLKRCYK